eukprot:g17787.t1
MQRANILAVSSSSALTCYAAGYVVSTMLLGTWAALQHNASTRLLGRVSSLALVTPSRVFRTRVCAIRPNAFNSNHACSPLPRFSSYRAVHFSSWRARLRSRSDGINHYLKKNKKSKKTTRNYYENKKPERQQAGTVETTPEPVVIQPSANFSRASLSTPPLRGPSTPFPQGELKQVVIGLGKIALLLGAAGITSLYTISYLLANKLGHSLEDYYEAQGKPEWLIPKLMAVHGTELLVAAAVANYMALRTVMEKMNLLKFVHAGNLKWGSSNMLLTGAIGISALFFFQTLHATYAYVKYDGTSPLGEDPEMVMMVATGDWSVNAGVGVIGPMLEELAFRGVIFRDVARMAGFPAAYLISAVGFGLIHDEENSDKVPVCIMAGALLCWAFHATGSLAVPIAMHMFINSIQVYFASLTRPGDPAESREPVAREARIARLQQYYTINDWIEDVLMFLLKRVTNPETKAKPGQPALVQAGGQGPTPRFEAAINKLRTELQTRYGTGACKDHCWLALSLAYLEILTGNWLNFQAATCMLLGADATVNLQNINPSYTSPPICNAPSKRKKGANKPSVTSGKGEVQFTLREQMEAALQYSVNENDTLMLPGGIACYLGEIEGIMFFRLTDPDTHVQSSYFVDPFLKLLWKQDSCRLSNEAFASRWNETVLPYLEDYVTATSRKYQLCSSEAQDQSCFTRTMLRIALVNSYGVHSLLKEHGIDI